MNKKNRFLKIVLCMSCILSSVAARSVHYVAGSVALHVPFVAVPKRHIVKKYVEAHENRKRSSQKCDVATALYGEQQEIFATGVVDKEFGEVIEGFSEFLLNEVCELSKQTKEKWEKDTKSREAQEEERLQKEIENALIESRQTCRAAGIQREEDFLKKICEVVNPGNVDRVVERWLKLSYQGEVCTEVSPANVNRSTNAYIFDLICVCASESESKISKLGSVGLKGFDAEKLLTDEFSKDIPDKAKNYKRAIREALAAAFKNFIENFKQVLIDRRNSAEVTFYCLMQNRKNQQEYDELLKELSIGEVVEHEVSLCKQYLVTLEDLNPIGWQRWKDHYKELSENPYEGVQDLQKSDEYFLDTETAESLQLLETPTEKTILRDFGANFVKAFENINNAFQIPRCLYDAQNYLNEVAAAQK